MYGTGRTKAELIREVAALRARVDELESLAEEPKHAPGEWLPRELEEERERLLDLIPAAILFCDAETLDILDVNAVALDLYGYSKSEFLQLQEADIAARPEGHAVAIERAGKRREARIPLRYHRRKNGALFPVEVTDSRLTHCGRRTICMVVRDATYRKETEEALGRSEARYAWVERTVDLGTWEREIGSREATWSNGVYRICGVDRDRAESTFDFFLSLIHPEDRERMRRESEIALANSARLDTEYRIVRPDGGERVVHSIAETIGGDGDRAARRVGLTHDITDRKASEDALRRSEAHFRAIVENAPISISPVDLDGYTTVYNSALSRMLGYTAEEFARMRFDKFTHPDDVELSVKCFEELKAGKRNGYQMEKRYLHKDGHAVWGYLSTTVIRDAEGKPAGAIGMTMDIDARKRAEKERQRLISVVETSPDFIGISDLEGRSIFLNDAGQNLVGLAKAEEVAKTGMLNFIHPEDREEAENTILPIVIREGHWAGEGRLQNLQSGATIPVSLDVVRIDDPDTGKPMNIAVVARNLTERERAEQALREREARLRSVFLAAPVGIGVLSGHILIQVNDYMCDMAGYAHEELLEHEASVLYPTQEQYRRVSDEEHRQIAERGMAIQELQWKRKDGGTIDVLLSSSPLDPSDLSKGLTFAALDITESKRVRGQLEQSQQWLRSLAAKLTTIEERERRRIAVYLHDNIGQELALLQMKFGVLQAKLAHAGERLEMDGIHTLLDRAIRETRSLTFDLSPPILYELGLGPAIEWAAERISREHGITIELEDDGPCRPEDEDVVAFLFRAVRELMINVAKHAQTKWARVKISCEGDWVQVCVEDDGIGFKASEGVPPGGRVEGYGLFSIRERLAEMQGHFDIRSRPGCGTRCTLTAPVRCAKGRAEENRT